LLWTRSPAYDLLLHCRLCLTIVGANTAELASLAVPMLVLLPTQQLELMRAWDGIPGLLANLPLVGTGVTKLIGRFVLKRGLGLLAWPNIWAGREIVPEWVGHLLPKPVGDRVIHLLDHPDELETMRAELRQVRGEPGAAKRLAALVESVLEK
jgi:lipid A disaccharide synthetase